MDASMAKDALALIALAATVLAAIARIASLQQSRLRRTLFFTFMVASLILIVYVSRDYTSRKRARTSSCTTVRFVCAAEHPAGARLFDTTLDDDVLASARALAAQRGVPIGTIISDLARRGLSPAQPTAARNGIRLFPVRPDAGPVTPELVKTLAAEED